MIFGNILRIDQIRSDNAFCELSIQNLVESSAWNFLSTIILRNIVYMYVYICTRINHPQNDPSNLKIS